MSTEIDGIFNGNSRKTDGFPQTAADLLILDFVGSRSINISRVQAKRRRFPEIHLEQIVGHDEIWALCVRKPRPGWRFFGRFLERDALVLLKPHHKATAGNDYKGIANDVIESWKLLFGDQPPLRKANLAEYLTGPYFDVDTATAFR